MEKCEPQFLNKKCVLCSESYVYVLSAGVNSLFCPNSSLSKMHTLHTLSFSRSFSLSVSFIL